MTPEEKQGRCGVKVGEACCCETTDPLIMVHFSEKRRIRGGGGGGEQSWTCSDDVRSCKQFQVKVLQMNGSREGRKRRALTQPCVPIMDSSK